MSTTQHRPRKFSVQQDLMDFTSRILQIVNNTVCEKHGATSHGQPCWWIHSDGLALRSAICGKRASKMFTGQVSDAAVRRNGSLSNHKKNASRYPKKEKTS